MRDEVQIERCFTRYSFTPAPGRGSAANCWGRNTYTSSNPREIAATRDDLPAIATAEHTIASLTQKENLTAEKLFDGFTHTQYQDEVEERWGKDAYATSDAWCNAKSGDEKAACR